MRRGTRGPINQTNIWIDQIRTYYKDNQIKQQSKLQKVLKINKDIQIKTTSKTTSKTPSPKLIQIKEEEKKEEIPPVKSNILLTP